MAGISSVVGKKNCCCWLDLGWRSVDDFLENVRVKVYLNLKMYFSFKLKNEIIKTGVASFAEMEEVQWAGLICNIRVSL